MATIHSTTPKLGYLFFTLGQPMEHESTFTQESSPDGFILPVQFEQLDDVVSSLVANDLCDYSAIVRILQFSHRNIPLTSIIHSLEPCSS